MKKWIALSLALMMIFSATPGFANVLKNSITSGVVAENLKEPAGSNWVTGEGRHDLLIKWASSDCYLKKAVGMFHRGVSNSLAGWSEVIWQPIHWSNNSPVVVGQFYGLLAGLTWAVLRTSSGIVDLATFWVPYFYGVPLTKPALGLHTIHEYPTIDDPAAYNKSVTRRLFESSKTEPEPVK